MHGLEEEFPIARHAVHGLDEHGLDEVLTLGLQEFAGATVRNDHQQDVDGHWRLALPWHFPTTLGSGRLDLDGARFSSPSGLAKNVRAFWPPNLPYWGLEEEEARKEELSTAHRSAVAVALVQVLHKWPRRPVVCGERQLLLVRKAQEKSSTRALYVASVALPTKKERFASVGSSPAFPIALARPLAVSGLPFCFC